MCVCVCGRAGWTELASMTPMQLHPLPPNQVGRSLRGLWKEDSSVGSELGWSGRHPHYDYHQFPARVSIPALFPQHSPTNENLHIKIKISSVSGLMPLLFSFLLLSGAFKCRGSYEPAFMLLWRNWVLRNINKELGLMGIKFWGLQKKLWDHNR